MRTHEHALISIGYAVGVSLLAGPAAASQGLTDPWLYLSALIGGELIDIIDHPLYHFVYNRKNLTAVQVRKTLREKGLKGLIKYYNEVEDRREIKGLLLHNVYALALVALVCILAAFFFQGSIYALIGAGAFLLHMILDTIGDYKILGHVDNWLWVLPKGFIDACGRMGIGLVIPVMAFGVFVQIGLFLVSFRWVWELLPKADQLGPIFSAAFFSPIILSYLPLVALALYHLDLLLVCVASIQKYRRELGNRPGSVPFSIGSMKELGRYLIGKQKSFEKVYLRMQADQGPWILFLAGAITTVLMAMTWIWGSSYFWKLEWQIAFLIAPVLLALLFGTLVHTTIGEYGGLWGVFLAWILNFILGRWGLQELWGVHLGYQLFVVAITAWVMGLMGGVFLRGQIRNSLVAFSIQVKCAKDNDCWLNDVLDLARDGLQHGYTKIHEELYGPANKKIFLVPLPGSLLLTPYGGRPVFGEDIYHFQAKDQYSPILSELSYVLCDNHLTSTSARKGNHGHLPPMPRQRSVGSEPQKSDMHLENNAYHWHSLRHNLQLKSAGSKYRSTEIQPYWLLNKTWGEYLDHFVTRKDLFRTDVFVYVNKDDPEAAIICGLACEFTSVREFATVEAEAYTSSVISEIVRLAEDKAELWITKQAAARLFYPRVSFWDIDMADWAEKMAGLPSIGGSFPSQDLEFIRKSLEQLSGKKMILSATADFRKKLNILATQYAVTGFAGFLPMSQPIREKIIEFVGKLFQ